MGYGLVPASGIRVQCGSRKPLDRGDGETAASGKRAWRASLGNAVFNKQERASFSSSTICIRRRPVVQDINVRRGRAEPAAARTNTSIVQDAVKVIGVGVAGQSTDL